MITKDEKTFSAGNSVDSIFMTKLQLLLPQPRRCVFDSVTSGTWLECMGVWSESSAGIPETWRMDELELESTFSQFARHLRELSSEGEHTRNIICSLSAIPMLIMLAEDVHNLVSADEGLRALLELSADQEAIEDMISAGVLSMLINRLSRVNSISTKSVQRSLDLFVAVEPYLADEKRVEVVSYGIVSSLIHIIKLPDKGMVKSAGRLLLALAVPSNLEYFQKVGTHLIEPIFIICTSNFESDIMDDGTSLLVKIMDPVQLPFYSMLDATSLLIRILSHSSRPVAQLNAALLLIELSKDAKFRKRILEIGGLAPLVIVKSRSSHKQLQNAAAFLVADLTIHEGLAFDETDLDS